MQQIHKMFDTIPRDEAITIYPVSGLPYRCRFKGYTGVGFTWRINCGGDDFEISIREVDKAYIERGKIENGFFE